MAEDLRTRAVKAIHWPSDRYITGMVSNSATATAIVDAVLAEVRAELLALADAIPADSSDNWTAHAPSVLREAADRIAPEPTPKEQR